MVKHARDNAGNPMGRVIREFIVEFEDGTESEFSATLLRVQSLDLSLLP